MLTSIVAGITGVAAIVGGLVYVFKYTTWLVVKTPAQKKEEIEAGSMEKQKEAERTGRPQ